MTYDRCKAGSCNYVSNGSTGFCHTHAEMDHLRQERDTARQKLEHTLSRKIDWAKLDENAYNELEDERNRIRAENSHLQTELSKANDAYADISDIAVEYSGALTYLLGQIKATEGPEHPYVKRIEATLR